MMGERDEERERPYYDLLVRERDDKREAGMIREREMKRERDHTMVS